jgi:glucose/arabinose dehydrogenase
MLNGNLADSGEFPYDIETIAINLLIPWAIDISQEGRLYVTERTGSIWIMENGRFLSEPLITFGAPFISRGEGGLMGIALDPDLLSNHYIYIMHSYIEDGQYYNRVVRLLERNNKATIDRVLLDKIPGGLFTIIFSVFSLPCTIGHP